MAVWTTCYLDCTEPRMVGTDAWLYEYVCKPWWKCQTKQNIKWLHTQHVHKNDVCSVKFPCSQSEDVLWTTDQSRSSIPAIYWQSISLKLPTYDNAITIRRPAVAKQFDRGQLSNDTSITTDSRNDHWTMQRCRSLLVVKQLELCPSVCLLRCGRMSITASRLLERRNSFAEGGRSCDAERRRISQICPLKFRYCLVVS